jgi:hypothetical protein
MSLVVDIWRAWVDLHETQMTVRNRDRISANSPSCPRNATAWNVGRATSPSRTERFRMIRINACNHEHE